LFSLFSTRQLVLAVLAVLYPGLFSLFWLFSTRACSRCSGCSLLDAQVNQAQVLDVRGDLHRRPKEFALRRGELVLRVLVDAVLVCLSFGVEMAMHSLKNSELSIPAARLETIQQERVACAQLRVVMVGGWPNVQRKLQM
jgi:hypothetical protein